MQQTRVVEQNTSVVMVCGVALTFFVVKILICDSSFKRY